MKISVIGLGKAGLPLAAVIADSGIEVVGVDTSKSRCEEINKGINPIPEEEGLSSLIKKYGGSGLKAVSDYSVSECSAHIVIVPLFIDSGNKPDFSILKNAFESLGKKIKKDDLIVLETTVPVKTTETLVKDILEKNSGMKADVDFYLAYSPERIMTGYSVSRFKEFPKIVGGIDEKSTEKAFEVYSKFSSPVKVSNARTAELTKVAEGTFRDINIAIANQFFKISEEFDIDFWEMREAAKHQFCNILEAGNVGGHCIPVYPWFLINELDVPFIKEARDLNDSMLSYYADKIAKLKPKKVAVIGLSYREGIKEKAFSRSVDMISLLKKKGYEVYGLDPMFDEKETEKEFGVKYLDNISEMDAIILMNKLPEYKEQLLKVKDKVVDVKNVLKK